jgi:hypothetical protein
VPPFVPLANGAQVELVFTLGGEVVENRLWFTTRQPPITQFQLDALAAGVAAWHTAQVMPLLSDQLQLAAVEAKDWTADPPPLLSVVTPLINGGNTSGCHSANVSIRVVFKGSTAQTFPNNANFVPGIPLDGVDTNTVAMAIRNDLFDAYVNLIDLASVFGIFPAWRWVITSRQLNYAWRSTQALARTDFIQFPSPYVAPRRRRLPR